MKAGEKMEALRVLNEQQLQLQSIMCEGDNHALKCVKRGDIYQAGYPEEFDRYERARIQFNQNEQEIARIEALVPDDEQQSQVNE